jgi:hypothetical protein
MHLTLKKYLFGKKQNLKALLGMFGITFDGSKSAFNTQKVCLKKKVLVGKQIKSVFKNPKSLK